jgi:hypothetical protein
MGDHTFVICLLERLFLGTGLLFAASAIIIASLSARTRVGEGVDVP